MTTDSAGPSGGAGPREIGHVHAWGMLDIAYLRALRDVLIGESQTGVHHLLDESGRTTFYIENPVDYDHARRLVRLSYLYHVNVVKKTPAGAAECGEVDVEPEPRCAESYRYRPSSVSTSSSRKRGATRELIQG